MSSLMRVSQRRRSSSAAATNVDLELEKFGGLLLTAPSSNAHVQLGHLSAAKGQNATSSQPQGQGSVLLESEPGPSAPPGVASDQQLLLPCPGEGQPETNGLPRLEISGRQQLPLTSGPRAVKPIKGYKPGKKPSSNITQEE